MFLKDYAHGYFRYNFSSVFFFRVCQYIPIKPALRVGIVVFDAVKIST